MGKALQTLEALPQVVSVNPSNDSTGWLKVELVGSVKQPGSDDYVESNYILKSLIHAEIPIQGYEAEGGRLQDVFLQLTTEEGIK
jgi:hypothetical protein